MKLTAKSRINAFDLLRGWCLIVISSDHLLRFPSVFDIFTGRGLLWVSAAEGFFFISGTLVGIVQGRRLLKAGMREAVSKMWSRAGKLYLASIILTLAYTALSYPMANRGMTSSIKGGLGYFDSLWELIWQTLTLKYSYGWTDFLNYYVVFMLLAPLALWLCKRGWWLGVVGAALGLWFLKNPSWTNLHLAYSTWQVYFFLGLVFGWYFEEIRGFIRTLAPRVRRALNISIFGLTGVTLIASFVLTFGTEFFMHHGATLQPLLSALHLPMAIQFHEFIRGVKDDPSFTYLFQDNRTGLLRLPLFLLWFSSLFLIVRRYEEAIIRFAGWLLLPLGKNSLYVYILQSVVVFGVTLLTIPSHYVINSVITVGAVLICWLAVRQQFLFRIIPR